MHRPSGIVVQIFSDELRGIGTDPDALWALAVSFGGWSGLAVAPTVAAAVAERLEQALGCPIARRDVIAYVSTSPVETVPDPVVRLLSTGEIDLLLTGPGGTIGYAFGSPQRLLEEGIVAGAIVGDCLVARAHTSCLSERYADVAVATAEEWRGRGLATASASLVCASVQAGGHVPIWSTGMDNWASQRIAQKLGFTEYSRTTYLVLPHAWDLSRPLPS